MIAPAIEIDAARGGENAVHFASEQRFTTDGRERQQRHERRRGQIPRIVTAPDRGWHFRALDS